MNSLFWFWSGFSEYNPVTKSECIWLLLAFFSLEEKGWSTVFKCTISSGFQCLLKMISLPHTHELYVFIPPHCFTIYFVLEIPNPTFQYALTCHILHRDCSRHITSLIRRVHQLYAFLLLRFCESEMTCSRSAQRNSSSLTEKSLNTTQQSDESIAAHNSFRLLWDKLHDFVLTSSQLSSAYLLSLVFRSLLYQAWESVDRNKSLAAAWKACAEVSSSMVVDFIFSTYTHSTRLIGYLLIIIISLVIAVFVARCMRQYFW